MFRRKLTGVFGLIFVLCTIYNHMMYSLCTLPATNMALLEVGGSPFRKTYVSKLLADSVRVLNVRVYIYIFGLFAWFLFFNLDCV